jgi:cytidine deaminase
MKTTKLEITVYDAASPAELPAEDAALLQRATEAAATAYAPYSKFNVGAAVLLDNGEVVCGSNQENAAYPSGLCAERVALLYANSRFPSVPVRAVAVNSSVAGQPNADPVYPCGGCRQSLLECENRFGKPIKVIMGGAQQIRIVNSIRDMLPLSFDLK